MSNVDWGLGTVLRSVEASEVGRPELVRRLLDALSVVCRQQCKSLYITGECCSLNVHGCLIGDAAANQG